MYVYLMKYVRLYLQARLGKTTILNRLAFIKLFFSSYAQVPISFTPLVLLGVFVGFLSPLLPVQLYLVKMHGLFLGRRHQTKT